MKRINVLSETVFNRIAAGEVVDRPYSVVKELVENSLDAGATYIEIHIEKGGKQLIKVADNGSGIFKDDLPVAFLPHATSKITNVNDLDKISTLGFRGEALASISSVSKTEIISVTEDNPAYKIVCEGGEIGKVQPSALEKGTTVTVRDLFYNTPVRAKFLKPDKKEETDISSFAARFILANPNVSFKYFADGKLVYQSFGGGPEEAVAQVYGAKVLSECIKIDALKDGVHIYGFIGNQNFYKPNKSYQSIFLNGRYIINNTIAVAISNAYASYMMKRQFPFYVLNIDVPPDIVDVNVHPNKADVRFVENNFIFGVIYKVISAVLDGTSTATEFVADSGRIPEIKSTTGTGSVNKVYVQEELPQEIIDKYKPPIEPIFPEDNYKKKLEEMLKSYPPRPQPPQNEIAENKTDEDRPFDPTLDLSISECNGDNFRYDNCKRGVSDGTLETNPYLERAKEIEERYLARRQAEINYENFHFCGALFNTYLIYEYQGCGYIIDQHAAHERIIYDKLIEQIKNRNIAKQPLLYPYVLEANPQEQEFIDKNINVLIDIGFDISRFSPSSYKINEVPADLSSLNLQNFFDDVLSRLSSYKTIKLEDVLKEKLAATACKHAVKGGMQLTEQEVKNLLKLMKGNVALKCPHGRPVCVTITKREIEKMFKRIV